MEWRLPVSPEVLTVISKIDHFQGLWSGTKNVPAERLARIEEAARTQSIAATCRLAGIRVTDADVAGVLRGESVVPPRDSKEILGYAAAMASPLPAGDRLLSSQDLRKLHGVMLGREPSPWRRQELLREAFDAEGKAIGQVFPSLPPRMVESKTEELLTWLELELRSGEQHPVLVIGAFLLCLQSISPFELGNGRLGRLLAGLLLQRKGYSFIPYASIEAQMEERRDDYHEARSRAQARLWTDEADLTPWLVFFLQVLGRHRAKVKVKLALERKVQDFPPLQRSILEAVREHGDVDAALLIQATGANRNTLKDNIRRLVQGGVLEKIGQRRATRYRMATGEPVRPPAEGPPEH